MPPRTPSSSGADRTDSDTGQERLLSAAVRLAGELPTARRLGILRGWGRTDRDRARLLRERLAHHGIHCIELSAVPEAGERHRGPQGRQRPRVGLLLHADRSQYDQALRAAALWDLPLLIERPSREEPGALTSFGAHRRPVIGVHLPGGALDIAVRQATITCLQPHPGSAYLLLDNEKLTAPAARPLQVGLTADGTLEVRSDAFATRRVRRLRYERPWGVYRLDIDGTPAHDVRAPLRLEPMPGRLHLLHP
ncbi:hypothetical protein J7E88_12645 [Streptomyces sp. ISL-10]|uniref:hypothetical protein n=1 Tax=Streptomyces sp. ISL-10 TaxID=2819172 RepID=UPI001BE833CD|nr:hypothetical protein [Streptomyces sp. ISL-10]MBT2366133.1 hypothetical protein [Streptomyces sp. ISL-10]